VSLHHHGLRVSDAEDLGARRLWPDVDRFGKVRAIYLADPDGNVVEPLDGPITAVAAAFLKYFPDADPGADK